MSQIKTANGRHILVVKNGQMSNKVSKMRRQHFTQRGGGGPLYAFCSESQLCEDKVPVGKTKKQGTDVHPGAEMKDCAQTSSLGLEYPLHYNMFENKS